MAEADRVSKLEALSYFIDLGWFQESDRSFVAIARHCLCPACQEKWASELQDVEAASLIANIRDCCSKTTGFIDPRLPLLEKIFRLFLFGGNEPLSLAEIIAQVTPYLDSPTSLSLHNLNSLLDSDQYYGFRQKSRAR